MAIRRAWPASLALDGFRFVQEARRIEALRRADEFKTVLQSPVSHHLRSPLTAIKAAIDSLRQQAIEWSDADRDSFHSTIAAETDRL